MAIDNFSGDYDFLSNFHKSPIVAMGKTWPTAEHLYHAVKTENREEQLSILNAETPGRAKRIGQKVTLRQNWNSLRYHFMKEIV